jgi:hypothetical protein
MPSDPSLDRKGVEKRSSSEVEGESPTTEGRDGTKPMTVLTEDTVIDAV